MDITTGHAGITQTRPAIKLRRSNTRADSKTKSRWVSPGLCFAEGELALIALVNRRRTMSLGRMLMFGLFRTIGFVTAISLQ